jgi:outer membrane protein assembly factor BamB
LRAIDALTGNTNWLSVPSGQPELPSPVVSNGRIFTYSYNDVAILQESSGNVLQQFTFPDISTPYAMNVGYGKIFMYYSATTNIFDNHLTAIDSISGTALWTSTLTQGSLLFHQDYSATHYPGLYDSLALITDNSGLHAYKITDGSQKWLFPCYPEYGFTVANHIIYFGYEPAPLSAYGYFTAMQTNGSVLWQIPGPARSAPCIVTKSGKVYRGSE